MPSTTHSPITHALHMLPCAAPTPCSQQNFSSRTNRFRPTSAPPAAIDSTAAADPDGSAAKGDPSRLGPGSYSVPDTWGKSGRHPGFKQAAFGSEAKRSGGWWLGASVVPSHRPMYIDTK